MVEIKHVIKDELGIHARPAGLIVRKCKDYVCNIHIGTAEKMADARRVMGIMTLLLKQNDEMVMTFEGEDEKEAAAEFENFLINNL